MKLSSLIGLYREKMRAQIQIETCKRTKETFGHSLLYGVGGTGKTELARCIGNELDCHFVETHAAAFKTPESLFSALKIHSREALRVGKPLFFFIDEIHRLKLPLQEGLYQAMKEWWIPTVSGKQRISPFTLFGATTRFDMLDSNSFVTRFMNVWEITKYGTDEMAMIVAGELSKHHLTFTSEVTLNIARRCLGIPRNAVNLANKVRITTMSQGSRTVTLDHARYTFNLEQIDPSGLNPVHHRYLRILEESRVNGHQLPLGVGSISSKMCQPEDVIKGSVEPVLFELSLVLPTPRGRIISEKGVNYLSSNNFEKMSKAG